MKAGPSLLVLSHVLSHVACSSLNDESVLLQVTAGHDRGTGWGSGVVGRMMDTLERRIDKEIEKEGLGKTPAESVAEQSRHCDNVVQSSYRKWCDEHSGFDVNLDHIDKRLQWCQKPPSGKPGTGRDDTMCYSEKVASHCAEAYNGCTAAQEDAAMCCVKVQRLRTGKEKVILSGTFKEALKRQEEEAEEPPKLKKGCDNVKQSSFRVWCDELTGFNMYRDDITDRHHWCRLPPTNRIAHGHGDADTMCYSAEVAQHCKEAYDGCTAVKGDARKCCVKTFGRRTGKETTILAETQGERLQESLMQVTGEEVGTTTLVLR